MIVRPSIQPSSPSRCTKAAVHGLQPEASAPRNPMAGSLRDGCAYATSSNPPAPQPRRAMISRLFNDRIGPLTVSDGLGGYRIGTDPSGGCRNDLCLPVSQQ